jgi:hypothetical protein
MKYTELTFTELVNKIGSSRFFDLPKMLKEVLSRLSPEAPKYKVYTALLTQSGTDAPVATVLENTLGNITWSYEEAGKYRANLAGAFTENKTFLLDNQDNTYYILKNLASTNYITYSTYVVLDDTLGDEFLNETPIEIRVYN